MPSMLNPNLVFHERCANKLCTMSWHIFLCTMSRHLSVSCYHRFKDGGQHLAAKRYLSGSAVPSIQNQVRGSRGHQDHGGQAGPLGLPHAALRDEIRGPRSGVLRSPTSALTDQTPQVESRHPGIPTHPSSSGLKSASFWESLE